MAFDPNFNGPVFNDFGQPVGNYNAYTGQVTLNQGVQNMYNPYQSLGPGTYNVGYNGQMGPNPMAPLGHIGSNGLLRFDK